MVLVSPSVLIEAMYKLEPGVPWQNTFAESAEAIAEASNRDPLYTDELGGYRTAFLLVALADHESKLKPTAIHPKSGAMGLFQIQPPTAHLVPTGERIKGNVLLLPRSAAPIAIELIRVSDKICRAHPVEERLIWYAQGGGDCVPSRYPEVAPMSRYIFYQAKMMFSFFQKSQTPRLPEEDVNERRLKS